MKKTNKILFFGSIAPPFNGQSIAFTAFYQSVETEKKVLIDVNFEDKNKAVKILLSLMTLFKIILVFLLQKPALVYFTCSRSPLGSIKDVVLIHIASLYSVPIITHLHGADFASFYDNASRFYQKIIKNAYLKVDTAIVLSHKMHSQFAAFPHLKIHTVANFFIKDEGLDENVKLADKSDEIQLLYLSNLMKTKGILLLLDAFLKIEAQYPKVKLNIAGDFITDYEMSAKQLRKQFYVRLKNLKNVKYLGITEGQDKINLLKQALIFVLPSHYKSEAMPLAIIEAMAYGCAIITTSHNYLSDLVAAENGLLVTPNSAKSLLAAIIKLIENPETTQQMAQHNIKIAQQKYTLDAYISALNKIVTEKGIF